MTSFQKLKDKWDKKLKESGFNDIENADGSLKNQVDPRTIANALQVKESREIYYSMARDFLRDFEFHSLRQHRIWAAHCDGISFRVIAKKFALTFYNVRTEINKLQKLARLRNG